ncbi:ash family protein [Rahnella sp. C60]|nr:ash family protein [Rahnella perminowiae]MBU9816945.1 ash family protein [Rahnella perminowiae]
MSLPVPVKRRDIVFVHSMVAQAGQPSGWPGF